MSKLSVKIVVIVFMFLSIKRINAQENIPYNNCWFGLMYQQNITSNTNLVVDVGYRTFNYTQDRRNTFGRFFLERIVSKNLTLGVGYAMFENYSFNRKKFLLENRPFSNLQFRWKKDKNEFFFRNRNEWRIYELGIKNTIRYRFQLAHEYQLSFLKSRVSYEYLLSTDKNNEQRYTVGVLLPVKKQRINLFYAINRQTNVKENDKIINQQVLGIQLQLTY